MCPQRYVFYVPGGFWRQRGNVYLDGLRHTPAAERFLSRAGHQYVHAVVSAARMLFAEMSTGNPTHRGKGSVATNQEILDLVASTPELEDSAVAIYNAAGGHSKLLPSSIAVYLHFRFGQVDADCRDLFLRGFTLVLDWWLKALSCSCEIALSIISPAQPNSH